MRTEGDLIKINDWLLPLSWIYGSIVRFRNWLFDIGLKKSRDFSIPVISVGNITVGGSGKTPHVEYLIRLLHDKVKIAVLSRGYKRKSHGYVLADENTEMSDIGDEPFQMHQKFSDIYVAVDAKRVRGINNLQSNEETKDVDVVLLDDAFQHRYVKPGINILLVDYHRLIRQDATSRKTARTIERKEPCRHRDYHQMSKGSETYGVSCTHQGYGSLSIPETLLHLHRLRYTEGCFHRKRTERSKRLSRASAHRHCISKTDGARPETDGQGDEVSLFRRPSPLQEQRHRPHQ